LWKVVSFKHMEKKTDKRSISRVPIHQSVRFDIADGDSGHFENVVKEGIGLDISSGGIGLTTADPIEVGRVVKLLFPVAVFNASLPIYAEVMWSARVDGGERIGLRFLG
jgi:hypothetical protein